MSKYRRIRLDVYGRFRVDVIRRHGRWRVFLLGEEGKRSLQHELPQLSDDASPDEILLAVDALYHELAEPGRELVVIDVLMA